MRINSKNYRTVWFENTAVYLINQHLLPHRFEIFECKTYQETIKAIKTMVVRGAPAIGAAAAFALTQAALAYKGNDFRDFLNYISKAKAEIAASRPTAYDLFYALDFIEMKIRAKRTIQEAQKASVLAAQDYAGLSVEKCLKIGTCGEKLIKKNAKILTHCNAGALATVDIGTALAPIRIAQKKGKAPFIFVSETRPRSQGSKLTAFELAEEGIKHAVIADNAAGYYMQKKEIDLVIVGSDRVAANGDCANKIGTYEKAVLAKENNIPFYVAVPVSSIDFNTKSGKDIKIEHRSEDEVHYAYGLASDNTIKRVRTTPEKSPALNPAFDITPARYITGIITEYGIVKPNDLKRFLKSKNG